MACPELSIRLRALALAAICAASLGVAACGGESETTASSTAAIGATGTSGTDSGDESSAVAALRTQLEASGIPSEGVDCIVDKLQGALDDVAADATSAELPPGLIDAATEATTECAQETGAGAP